MSWFDTAGSISSSRSFFEDCADCAATDVGVKVATSWTPPDAAALATFAETGEVRFWAVLRDDRGGVDWLTGSAQRK